MQFFKQWLIIAKSLLLRRCESCPASWIQLPTFLIVQKALRRLKFPCSAHWYHWLPHSGSIRCLRRADLCFQTVHARPCFRLLCFCEGHWIGSCLLRPVVVLNRSSGLLRQGASFQLPLRRHYDLSQPDFCRHPTTTAYFYQSWLEQENPLQLSRIWGDAMYFATLADTGEDVIVKITPRYSKKAHGLLAKAGLAPTLHFCELMVENLYMVVMGCAKGKSIWQLVQEKETIPAALVLEQVEAAISCLHDANLVFGDLRDANVLYSSSDGSAEGKILLIDFDWADEDGKGRYPPTLNISNGWAEGVIPWGVMRKEHDLWQFDRLKKLCDQ